MKKKLLVITLAMALILTSCSKEESKDKKVKEKETTEAAEAVDTSENKTSDAASEDPSGAATEDASGADASAATEDPTEAPTETTAESTTQATEETTTAAPTETSERDPDGYVYDLTGMTAEEIADICDSLTTRKIPKVGDTEAEVVKNYYDVEPYNFTQVFCGRYSSVEVDNVNCIYISGVFLDGTEEEGGPFVRSVELFGTGIVLDIYDYEKAVEFIKIMKERHPVLEEKPDGSWRGEDFVVGITPIDFFYWENGVHFQIAYGEKSSWYESVAGIFGFGMEITVPSGETEQVDGQEEIQVQVDV